MTLKRNSHKKQQIRIEEIWKKSYFNLFVIGP